MFQISERLRESFYGSVRPCYVLVLFLQDVAKIDRKSVNFNWLGKACSDMYWVLKWFIIIPGISTPAGWVQLSFGSIGKKFTVGRSSE